MSQTTPTTPSRNSAQRESTVSSTPNSKGIANASQNINDLKRANTARWLRDDVEKTKLATIDAMFHTLTRRICNDQKANPKETFQKILTITNKIVKESQALQMESTKPRRGQNIGNKALKELAAFHREFVTAQKEADTYSPWVNMTNTALSLLRNETVDQVREYDKEINLVLQHNDPNILRYKHNSQESSRKPDSIFMTTWTACTLHSDRPRRSGWTNDQQIAFAKEHAISSPTGKLDWGDSLSSIEYKRHKDQTVDLKEATMPEPKSFEDVLVSEHIWERKRKSSGNKTEDKIATKSQKPTRSDSPHRSASRTGPSHSEQTASSGANVPQSPASATTDWTKSVAIQSAEYALNRLCCSFDITHTFNFILIDTTLYISWYDHEGIITTEGFDVAKYLSHYLALLFILQRFNRSDWGRCGHSPFDTAPNADQTTHEVKINDNAFLVDLTQGGLVHKGWAIGGRSSCLRTCRMKEGNSWSEQRYVIKFSWKERTRKSEGEIMRRIRGEAANDPQVLEFIPEFVTDSVFPDISTEDIRKSLGIDSNAREFVVVVMAELDGTIMDLTGEDLWNVFWDCFRCHYHLWKLGIRHRDISTGNLMYRKDKDGHIYGTLSDFDLSSVGGEPSNNKQRTGTLPFMAIELLSAKKPIPHEYEHDVQSFYWVLLWVVLCAENGRADCPMLSWGNLGMEALWKEKSAYITVSNSHDEFQPAEPRRGDFERFLGVRLAVEQLFVDRRAKALKQKRLEVLDSERQPQITPLDQDEVYKELEKGRTWGVKHVPLEKVRPKIPRRS